jgi:hypothetical protein
VLGGAGEEEDGPPRIEFKEPFDDATVSLMLLAKSLKDIRVDVFEVFEVLGVPFIRFEIDAFRLIVHALVVDPSQNPLSA